MSETADNRTICHRCGCELQFGSGELYVVQIEAFADPTPPRVTAEELQTTDFKKEIDEVIGQLAERSPQELMDDVHRRLTLHLCNSCYRKWIDDPAA